MKLVIIESPYSGDIERNVEYARLAMLDSLTRGEAPFVSHLSYTQVLDDEDRDDRALGMKAGFAWGKCADLTAVYQDYGISPGMKAGIDAARCAARPVIYRTLFK